jgi:hypothetical protein
MKQPASLTYKATDAIMAFIRKHGHGPDKMFVHPELLQELHIECSSPFTGTSNYPLIVSSEKEPERFYFHGIEIMRSLDLRKDEIAFCIDY